MPKLGSIGAEDLNKGFVKTIGHHQFSHHKRGLTRFISEYCRWFWTAVEGFHIEDIAPDGKYQEIAADNAGTLLIP
jgi:hypothetical protein